MGRPGAAEPKTCASITSCEGIDTSYNSVRGQSMRPNCRRLVCPPRSYHNVLQGIRGWYWTEIILLYEVAQGA